MRRLALSALLLVPSLALAAADGAAAATLEDVAAAKGATTWSAADAPPAQRSGPRQSAPVTPRRHASEGSANEAPASGPAHQVPGKQATQVEQVRSEAAQALEELARAKLAAADAIAAHAALPDVHRIPLADYQLVLQRATCAAVHGSLETGEGASCLVRASVPNGERQDDDEEVQACAANGGVLVERMAACTQASVQLAGLYGDEEASVGLESLVGAFAEVARQCWGRTLCVE